MPLTGMVFVATGVLGVCLPAAKIVARLVERKSATFTLGGASFLGLVIAPGLLALINMAGRRWGLEVPVAPTLAAIAIAYALGEGAGRLACISFGCCYGRPLARSHPLYRTLFSTLHFTFTGTTKKAAYEVPRPSIVDGLATLWSPAIILLLQALWLGLFLYTGRSVVTAATISFHVVKERI